MAAATNFQAPSYSPITGWVYLAFSAGSQRYVSDTPKFESGRQYPGGRGAPSGQTRTAGIKAIDPETGKTMWEFPLTQGSLTSGVLATAGGVVFAASREGYLFALDARTGASLWRFQTGAAIDASPISYSVAGKQFVAVSAGNVVYSFALRRMTVTALRSIAFLLRSHLRSMSHCRAQYAVRRTPDLVQLEDTRGRSSWRSRRRPAT